MTKHFVYIVECSDKTLYTGYAVNVEKRIETHNNKKGAKYTKYRTPVTLKYFEELPDKSTALRREIAIKKLTRLQKLILIKNWDNS